MNAGPPVLTEVLLDALEARWREQGAPIVAQLQPGIDDAAMAEITARVGLTVPSEARTWYRWHNGAADTGWRNDVEMGGMGWRFLPLERSIALVHHHRRLALEAWKGDEAQAKRGFWWTWLPLSDNQHGGVMFVDGDAASDPPTAPVRYTEPEFGGWTPPPAPSLGQVVTWWIEAIDTGLYAYDTKLNRWYYDIDARDQVDQRADEAAGRRFLV